jgi:hypothetical protein
MPQTKAGRPRARRSVGRAAVLSAAAALVLGGWLLASPPGASPDDGYHLAGIWCSRGYDDARCVEAPGSNDAAVFVPQTLSAVTCTAFDNTRSAACVLEALSLPPSQLTRAMSGNIRGERPGLYYRTMHTLISDDFPTAFARIRLANAAALLLLVSISAMVAPLDIRRALLTTWIVAVVPLGLFLVTSLNTTAWGLIGVGTLWANSMTALRPIGPIRRLTALVLAAIGAVLATGARTEGSSHVTVALAAVLAWWALDRWGHTVGRRARRLSNAQRGALAAASLAMLALASVPAVGYLVRTSLWNDLAAGWERLRERGLGNPLVALGQEIPELWTGGLGDRWGLGWLDTPMPPLTSVTMIVVYTALITLGLQHASLGRRAAGLLLLAAMIALPLLSLLRFGLVVQEELQPRHYLPVLFVLLGIALSRDRGRPPFVLTRGTRLALGSGLSIAHAMALLVTQRRYTSGLVELRYVDLSRPIEWWWAHGPSPMAAWAIASLAYAVLAFTVLAMHRESVIDHPSSVATTMPATRLTYGR